MFTLEQPSQATVKQETAERIYIMRPVGKRDIPELQAGPARIVVRAARPVLYGMRQAESEATRDVEVRLDPPRVAVLSTFHYINHGGAEFVVYRATPADVESGVRVGDRTYPGFPAAGAGIKADESTKVAFFALLPRPGAEHADLAVRARPGRQRSDHGARPSCRSPSRSGAAGSRSTTGSSSASSRPSPQRPRR